MISLTDMELEAKRELGYDLEPVVGREVRGRGHEELESAIIDAVQEGGAQAEAVLREHGLSFEDRQDDEKVGDSDGEPDPTPEPDGELVAIQLFDDPIGADMLKGDVVPYPVDGARGYTHRELTLEAAIKIVADGGGRWNFRASKKTRDEILGVGD